MDQDLRQNVQFEILILVRFSHKCMMLNRVNCDYRF